MPQILTGPPHTLIAGDNLTFSVRNPDYPSGSYALSFTLFNMLYPNESFAGAAQSDGSFLVVMTCPQTADVLPREYAGALVFTATGERKTVPTGAFWVIPDLTQNLNPSPNQVQLQNYEEVERKLSLGTNLSVSINGQVFTKKNIKEITNQIVWLQSRILKEKQQLNALLGQPTSGRIVTEFVGVQTEHYPGFTGGPSTWP